MSFVILGRRLALIRYIEVRQERNLPPYHYAI